METAFILLTSELGFEREILEFLETIPEVKEAFRLYGVYDIIFRVEADTREDIKASVRKIKQMKKVRSTLTMVVI